MPSQMEAHRRAEEEAERDRVKAQERVDAARLSVVLMVNGNRVARLLGTGKVEVFHGYLDAEAAKALGAWLLGVAFEPSVGEGGF